MSRGPVTHEVRTARLVLRPFREDDAEALHAIFSDPRAMRYWDRPAWEDIAQTRRLLRAFMHDSPLEFAVDLEGTLIGRVGLWRRYEIGYILQPSSWGQGFGREAVEKLLQESFRLFPEAPCLTAEVDPRNSASIGLLDSLGFHRVGLVEQNFDYGGIETCDTAYYELPRPSSEPDTA